MNCCPSSAGEEREHQNWRCCLRPQSAAVSSCVFARCSTHTVSQPGELSQPSLAALRVAQLHHFPGTRRAAERSSPGHKVWP